MSEDVKGEREGFAVGMGSWALSVGRKVLVEGLLGRGAVPGAEGVESRS